MLTVVLDPRAQDAAGLTQYANQLIATYKQNKGVIVRPVSDPATAQKPAEYFVAAMLPGPNVMEFAAARLILVGRKARQWCIRTATMGTPTRSLLFDVRYDTHANGPHVQKG